MSVDPNAPSSGQSSLKVAFNAYLSDPLSLPQAFTQWIYQVVANPAYQPAKQGVASVAAPLTQTYADSGHTDFFSQGAYVVEVVLSGSVIGSAFVHCGLSTADGTTRTVVIGAQGVNGAGTAPTFSVQNNNSSTGVFRVLTAAASGLPVTVTYRRLTVTS